jgi:hypothetical protein
MLNSLTNQTAVIVILAVLTITGPALFFLLAQQAHAQNMTTAAATTSSPSGIKLSPQPIYQESSPPGNITPINQTHGILTFTGGGMLTLPNTTQTINTTHNGTAIISFTTSSGYGRETIRTQAGETVTATVYEIVQFNNTAAAALASLNGVIAAGIDDMSPSGESHVTLWRWESGSSNTNNNTSSDNSTGITPSSPTTQGETLYE